MKTKFWAKVFTYFVCLSFLLMMGGFPGMIAVAKEKSLPVGEMVSRGEVKFEARENVWKMVESSYFPIFQGTRMKTEKGMAVVTLSNNGQIEIGSSSLFSFSQNDQFILFQGSIEFRIPSSSEINFKVGNLSIIKSRSLQAQKGASVSSPMDEEIIGSISIHSNGSVTVKSIRGKLSVLNQNHVVLAALSSQETVTIPSVTVGGKPGVMVAQVGETEAAAGAGGFLGVSTGAWIGIGLAAVAVGAGVGIASTHGGGVDEIPLCP
jgi:hypothetical protein